MVAQPNLRCLFGHDTEITLAWEEPSLTRPEAALTGFVLAVGEPREKYKQSLGTFPPAVALAAFDWLIESKTRRRPIAVLRAFAVIATVSRGPMIVWLTATFKARGTNERPRMAGKFK